MMETMNMQRDDWPEQLRQFAGLIFDCDGTLADSMPQHYEAWHETMMRYDIDFDETTFYSWGGMPTEKIIERLSKRDDKSLDVAKVAAEKEAAFERRADDATPYPEVVAVVRQMSGRMPMSVASGGLRDIVRRQVAALGLAEALPVVVASEDTERHKPEPDVFLEAARRMGVEPTRCLVWEDSPLGVRAAEAAGMACVDVAKDPWRTHGWDWSATEPAND